MVKRLFIPILLGLFIAIPVGAQETGAGAPGAKSGAADTAKISTNRNRQVFTIVEEMPQFPGGVEELLKFIRTTMRYPVTTGDNIEGRVTVLFTVNEDGSLSDIEVVRSLDPLLDKEAVRIVEAMPKWTPGKQDGAIVAAKYTVPITFRFP